MGFIEFLPGLRQRASESRCNKVFIAAGCTYLGARFVLDIAINGWVAGHLE